MTRDDLPETETDGKREDYPEAPQKKAKPAKAHPVNNIQFVGKKRLYVKDTGELDKEILMPADEVPRIRRNGRYLFKLPDGETQLKGFYHEDATFLLRAYPDQFKRPVVKG